MNPIRADRIESRTLVFLLVSVALIVAPHALHVPPVVFGFFCVLLAWRFLAVRNRALIPRPLVLLLCTLLGTALMFSQHRGLLGRDAGTSLFIIALALKLHELKSQRDLYLVAYLTFFVAATQFLFLENIFMAVYILLTTCLLLTVLIDYNSPGTRLLNGFKTAATLIAQAIPVMIVMFVFFPRVDAPRWLLFTEDHKALTGLSEILEPGTISELGLSPELAFRVSFEGDIPPPRDRYWRGPVLSRTDGTRWAPAASKRSRRIAKPEFAGIRYDYTITQEPQTKNWVFALDLPARYPHGLFLTADNRLLAQKELHKRSAFRLTSFTRYNTGAISENEKRLNQQLPREPSLQIADLVESFREASASAEATVRNALDYFKNNEFIYTLTPPLLPEDPIETFLFKTREGYCSHYATAFVYLMRAAGIPARVVTGYQGGTFNPMGEFLEVRQANAHAWAEVWLQGEGWVRVDPTAAVAPERVEKDVNIDLQIATGEASFKTIDMRGLGKLMVHMRFAWYSIDYAWQRWVLNYTSFNQTQFLSKLGINDLKSMTLWLAAGIAGATALAAILVFGGPRKRPDKVIELYRKFRSKLKSVGLEKKPGEGAGDFGRRATQRLPKAAEQIRLITALYLNIRYGRFHTKKDLELLARKVRAFHP
ncbi:MAG: DUF3488 and transglutaminase-like domain-containing protein [Pseudomonadota bacterium]